MSRRIALPLACLLLSTLSAAPAWAAQSGPNFCAPGVQPSFQLGFATLKEKLGDRMGGPTECEHPDAASGDSLAHTSTGLAFYRQRTNTASFTNGTDHWALLPNGLGHWIGSSIDPPTITFDDIRYLVEVIPLAEQEGNLGPRLEGLGANVTQASPAFDELNSIRAELADISDQLNALTPGPNTQSLANSMAAVNNSLIDLLDTIVGLLQSTSTTEQARMAAHLIELLPQLNTQLADMEADFNGLTT